MEQCLDDDLSLDDYSDSVSDENNDKSIEKDLVGDGVYLGLDISELSTGVCLYRNGSKNTYNFTSETSSKEQHYEVLLRRELKRNLRSIIFGLHFDVIIIEDVFQGVNPSTTRVLHALNTAIDEMVLDGEVSCEKFLRVSNKRWKSWLFKVDKDNVTKGYNDKLRIETCLGMLGVSESGVGYQDRLDATGMILGYLMCKEEADKKELQKTRKRVAIEDIEVCYDFERSDVFTKMYNDGVESYENVNIKNVSKTKILDLLTENPEKGFISLDYVLLGRVAEVFDLPVISGGGVLGFWVKRKKLYKYIKEE